MEDRSARARVAAPVLETPEVAAARELVVEAAPRRGAEAQIKRALEAKAAPARTSAEPRASGASVDPEWQADPEWRAEPRARAEAEQEEAPAAATSW
jgi:hypothetical protein